MVYAFIVPLFVQRSTAPNKAAPRRCRGATDTANEAGRDGPVQEEFATRLNNRPEVPGLVRGSSTLQWFFGGDGTEFIFQPVQQSGADSERLTLWVVASGIAQKMAIHYLVVHPTNRMWVTTLVINGIDGVSPLITGVTTHLLSGMNHQVVR